MHDPKLLDPLMQGLAELGEPGDNRTFGNGMGADLAFPNIMFRSQSLHQLAFSLQEKIQSPPEIIDALATLDIETNTPKPIESLDILEHEDTSLEMDVFCFDMKVELFNLALFIQGGNLPKRLRGKDIYL